MAPIYGQPGHEWGDRLVYEVLQSLPDDCIVYAQPTLVYRQEVRDPDYVIVYHKWGVIVLEVKDWVDVVDRDRHSAWVRRSDTGQIEREASPVRQARTAAQVLSNMLSQDADLIDYAGERTFSYAFGGVLPHLPPPTVSWLEKEWGEGYVLGRDDLNAEVIAERISMIPVPYRLGMTEHGVRAACAIIDPSNKLVDRCTGEFKGVVDRDQEWICKEPIRPLALPELAELTTQLGLDPDLEPAAKVRVKHIEQGMLEEAVSLGASPHVRLVRGFAGTGKTDVLILRAHYLHEQYPDLDILVTTFNDPLYANRLLPELKQLKPRVDIEKFDTICAGIYRKKHGRWIDPQDTRGLVARMARDHPLVDKLGETFVTEEFIWMKETGRTERNRYVSEVREGRGGKKGRVLNRDMKQQVFDLFESYEERLRQLPAYDWVDLHDKACAYLEEGIEPDKRYDVILVDEGQHFAPTWMRIVKQLAKPGGTLFICDDPSQSVYRYYSWHQKGVEVMGRTRWLRIPYRNTRQIFLAAYSLIADNAIAQRLVSEGGEAVSPDVGSDALRNGPAPEVHYFQSREAESQFVLSEIDRLVRQDGLLPAEIAILHSRGHVLDRYRTAVPKGLRLYKIEQQTGMEYKVIFVPEVQQVAERTVGMTWEEDEAKQRLKFYMTMTRARERVYLLHQGRWPSLLEPVRPYVKWIVH